LNRSLFNSTVLRKDFCTGEEEVLTFPGISGNDTYHVSGVQYDRKTGAMYFSANNGIAFSSKGADLTGPNRFIKYDTSTDQVVFIADMDSVVAQLSAPPVTSITASRIWLTIWPGTLITWSFYFQGHA
jgi:hypothetical protein